MKYNSLFFILPFLYILSSCNELSESQVDLGVVEKFYDNIAIIVNNPDSDDAYIAKEDCFEMCKVSDLSMNFPNEFKWMGVIDREDKNLSIISYITLLRKFANRNKAHFLFTVEDAYPLFDEKKDSCDMFYYYLVKKQYSIEEGFMCSFTDTVLVSSDSLIVGIKNQAGGHAFTKSEKLAPIPEMFTKQ